MTTQKPALRRRTGLIAARSPDILFVCFSLRRRFATKRNLKTGHDKNMRYHLGKYTESLRQYGEVGYEENRLVSGHRATLSCCYATG